MRKRIFIFTIILMLFSVMTVYASDALHGYFLDYEKVKVVADGEEIKSKVPGFIVESSTVLPLRAVAESLGTITKWDQENKTAILVKPNVNMLFTTAVRDTKGNTMVYAPFGKISQSMRYNFNFYVYSEVDNLPREKVEIKVVLYDPEDKKMQEGDVVSFDATSENSLQYINYFKDITFVKSGTYHVDFLLKSESTNDKYMKIGERFIYVK